MITRRRFTPEFKARVVLEVISGAKQPGEVCREYEVSPRLLARWKTQFLAQAGAIMGREHRPDEAQVRIAQLERLVGRLTLELEVANKAAGLLASRASGNGSRR